LVEVTGNEVTQTIYLFVFVAYLFVFVVKGNDLPLCVRGVSYRSSARAGAQKHPRPCTPTHPRAHMHTRTHPRARTHAQRNAKQNPHPRTYAHTHVPTRARAHARAYARTRTHAHTYAHTWARPYLSVITFTFCSLR